MSVRSTRRSRRSSCPGWLDEPRACQASHQHPAGRRTPKQRASEHGRRRDVVERVAGAPTVTADTHAARAASTDRAPARLVDPRSGRELPPACTVGLVQVLWLLDAHSGLPLDEVNVPGAGALRRRLTAVPQAAGLCQHGPPSGAAPPPAGRRAGCSRPQINRRLGFDQASARSSAMFVGRMVAASVVRAVKSHIQTARWPRPGPPPC